MVLQRCGLFWTVSYICKECLETHFKMLVPLKTYQCLFNNPKQHAKPNYDTSVREFFATHKSPNSSRHSGHSNNAEPSLQISVDLSRLGSISVMSKLTFSVAVILASSKIEFGYSGKELCNTHSVYCL